MVKNAWMCKRLRVILDRNLEHARFARYCLAGAIPHALTARGPPSTRGLYLADADDIPGATDAPACMDGFNPNPRQPKPSATQYVVWVVIINLMGALPTRPYCSSRDKGFILIYDLCTRSMWSLRDFPKCMCRLVPRGAGRGLPCGGRE